MKKLHILYNWTSFHGHMKITEKELSNSPTEFYSWHYKQSLKPSALETVKIKMFIIMWYVNKVSVRLLYIDVMNWAVT